jgi:hypothetical protein
MPVPLVVVNGGPGREGISAQAETDAITVQVLTPGEIKPRRLRCSSPPQATELGQLLDQRFEVHSRFAAELGGAFFSVSASGRRLIIVQDFYRAAPCQTEDGTDVLYGASVRLLIGVSGFEANAKLTLPVIAAAVQLGNMQARYRLEMKGYRGKVGDLLAEPDELNVETYIKLIQSVRELRKRIADDTSNIFPEPLFLDVPNEPDQSALLRGSVGSVFALSQIADGRSLFESRRVVDNWSDEAQAAIEDVYSQFTEKDERGDYVPDRNSMERARDYLGQLRLRD